MNLKKINEHIDSISNSQDFELVKDLLDTFIKVNIQNIGKKEIYLKELSWASILYSTEMEDNYYNPGWIKRNQESKIRGLHRWITNLKTLSSKMEFFLVSSNEIVSNDILLNIHPDITIHINKIFSDWHYFTAVEESYKIVRSRLREITWSEKATESFNLNNQELIFWHKPINEIEKDYFDWIKYLHMAIQFLRNEKSHTPAREIESNRALHYIYLASLALYLIDKN